MKSIKLFEDDFNTLVVCAFRYALGRETYVVDDVAGIIEAHLDKLTEQTLQCLKQDFERLHDFEQYVPRAFRADFDKKRWMMVEGLILERLGEVRK